jgi:hypothetical protein
MGCDVEAMNYFQILDVASNFITQLFSITKMQIPLMLLFIQVSTISSLKANMLIVQ